MMKVFSIMIFSLLVSLSSFVEGRTTFTNVVNIEDRLVFAAVKKVETGMEMESHLLEVNLNDFQETKVKLPKEIDSREVVGLLPTKDGQILVVTQITRGGGDKPLVHRYGPSKKEWERVAEVDCISFSRINVTNNSLEFTCERTSDKGDVKKVVEKVSSPTQLYSSSVTLPVTKVESKDFKASLEGESFEWTKLKITRGKKEKVFTP